ncbi:MAG: DNA polymerase III subunit alpha [Candidatus Binatus sp.]|uniref:DNA polymerase III subunit alpha n=1 Tax=Candidatus Binatus sp. TaxID=2811406 RepID=UPI0027211B60|nr:DNA polymerase III subunit alpha [Candidatus Binatus sp.]MDO8431749.1 DNA polymerase III subunit alpha [Candidatus Binatus sp.]
MRAGRIGGGLGVACAGPMAEGAGVMSFVHLHVHTQYSLLDGANKIGPLIEHAKASGMEAIAMTDHGNMFGAVEFYQKAKAAGIKPIIGCEAYLAPGKRTDRSQAPRSDDFDGGGNFHLILLAQNREGYRNLCKLLTTAYQDGLYYKPRIDKEILAELSGGIIALSGCLSGELARWLRADRMDKARETAEAYAKMFPGRYYLELQDNKLHSPYNEALREIGKSVGLPLVATNDCHYLHRDDAKAHEVLLCIQTGKVLSDETRWRFDTDELYVKTPEEMAAAFGADSEELRNSVEIARRVDFDFEFGKFHFPVFKAGPGVDLDAEMEALARKGLAARLVEIQARRTDVDEAQYVERLDREIPVIREMGFSGYMLIVADFINYARSVGIPVGPGRGSVVGSLVSYALGITEVDPVEHRLLFERWLNPGRKSMPDIDVDFCFERRDEVLEYVRKKYGDDRVAQIITFGTIKGKQAIRDVGRVLGLSFAETDKIVKLYPAPKQGRDFPLADALEMEPRLKAERRNHPDLFNYAFKLEGLLRHASRHAAGVVISDAPLTDLVPLYVDKERDEAALSITQYSMKGVEEIGLIKFDFLALKNLTLITDTLTLIKAGGKVAPDLNRLGLDDPETYKMLSRGDTVGVFQLESSGMRRFITELKPTCFDDVIAAGSLFRPGPLDAIEDGKTMVQHYVDRKHGKEPVEYDHPLLEPVLRDTYGVIVYQEQVMRAAQALAGYTLEQADILRAAMGKKNKSVMEKERVRFVEGAKSNGVKHAQAEAIFEKIQTFASYGFNRSHAAAYALTTYTTAYLKAHFPREFMAALMSLDMDDVDKTYKNIAALREMKIAILPPDVNQSRVKFAVTDGAIRFGLAAIRGVGAKPAQAIIAEREASGPFEGLADFCLRVGTQLVSRRVLDALIKCGAFDSHGIARAALMAQAEQAIKIAQKAQSDAEKNQIGLFGGAVKLPKMPAREPIPEWDAREKLKNEKEALGFYITAHPLDKYDRELARIGKLTTNDLAGAPDGSQVQIAGVIHAVKLKNNKSGKRYATFSLEDRAGAVEAIAWSETYQRFEAIIMGDEPVVARGKLDVDDERAQIIIESLVPLDSALVESVREVRIRAPLSLLDNGGLDALKNKLSQYRGKSLAYLYLGLDDGREAVMLLGDSYRVTPTESFVADLEQILSPGSIELR